MPDGDPVTIVEQWRSELLARILRIVFVLGVAVAIPSIWFALTTDRIDVVIVDVIALAAVATVTFVTRITYRIRAITLLLTLFLLGGFFITTVGVVGIVYLLAFPVMAAILLGTRPAVLALVLNAATLAIVGVSRIQETWLTVPGIDAGSAWLPIILNFLFVNAVLALSGAMLLGRIERLLVEEHELSTSLVAEREELDARNRDLERAATERARAQEQQRFQSQLLDAVGEAVVATGLEGVIRYANPAARRLFGWSDGAVGRSFEELSIAIGGAPDDEDLLSRLRDRGSWTGELEIPRRDGSTFPALVTAAPYLDADGHIAGIIGVSADVTEMRATIDRLARSDEIRIAFLRATSHELRTPLTAIVGFVETLREHGEAIGAEGRNELVERLSANADRLERLITDLLDIDRLSAGMITANREPYDLAGLVRRVVGDVQLGDRRAELRLDPVMAEIDAPKIERVVANLVTNAVRHSPAGGTVVVELVREGNTAVLHVSDDGPGISPGYLELVFEPFVQGPERHHEAKPGTGLGLSLSRELVKLHDGAISVHNRSRGGACFEVRLPDPSGRPTSVTAAAPVGSGVSPALSG